MSNDDVKTKNALENAGKYLPIAIFILAAFILAKYINIASLKILLENNERLGYLICLIAFILLDISIIPSDPVTLLVIAWKGPLAAIILSTIGDTISGIVEYYIGDRISNIADFEKKKAKLPFHLDRLPMNSPLFLILARMLPGFGPKFVSLAGGIYEVPMTTYLWTALVANLLGAIVTVSGGYGLIKLFLNLFK